MTRTVSVRLMADVADFTRKVGGNAVTSVKSLSGELDKANRAGKLDKVTHAATGLGLGLVGVAGAAVKMAADFDKQMSAVSAATHAGTKDIAALRAAAIEAGKDTQYSATEAAKGVTELAKAGVGTADILGGGLKGALSLAAAGQLDVGEAAETAASAMTQFGLSGKDIPHVADLLAAAAGKAQGSVHDMGYALSQSGLVASQFGLSVDDATGTLAAFAHAGLIGSDAGTSFKTMLLHLANPSEQVSKQMDAMGISAYDAQGKFVGITNLAGQLHDKLKGVTQQQRDATLAMMFGTDAIRGANVLYEQGAQGIQGWINKVNDAGYASTTAAKLTDNLAGDIERLKGSVETLAIESGSGANGGLRFLTKAVNGLVNEFLGLPPAVGGTLTVLAGVGGALILGSVAWLKYRETVAKAQAQLIATGPAGEKAATALGRVTSALGKVGLAAVALEVVGAAAEQLRPAAADANRLTESIKNLADTGKATGEMAKTFGNNLDNLALTLSVAQDASHGFWGGFNRLINTIPGAGSVVDAFNERVTGMSFDKATADTKALDAALTQYMTTTGDATKSNELWSSVLRQSGLDTSALAALLPDSYKKVGELNAATEKGAAATGQLNGALQDGTQAHKAYTTATDASAAALRGERDALSDLSKTLRAETDPVFGLLDAERGLTQAQKDAAKATKDHGAKSEEAKEAVRKLALAALDLQGKVGALGGTFDGKMTPALQGTLRAAGLTDKQIKDVAAQFVQAKTDGDKFAKDYNANATVTGVPKVKAALTGLLLMQEALKKGVPASAIAATNKNTAQGFASGGFTGPGSKYQEAGVVHAGEYVFNAKATSRLGVSRLDAMHKSAQMPGYANGGMVLPFPTTASMTRIPSRAEAQAVVGSAGPTGGGSSYRWIEAIVRAAFPGLGVISDFRPGAVTLSGNRSYHAVGRAVDYPPSLPLAEWFNLHYFGKIKELITPWNNLNIKNGQRHTYTGAVWNQHNFAGGNAHDHVAMFGGGVINEPVFGYGASGRSYSFGERGTETVVPGMPSAGGGRGSVTYQISVNPTATAHPADIGREIVSRIKDFERGSGSRWRSG